MLSFIHPSIHRAPTLVYLVQGEPPPEERKEQKKPYRPREAPDMGCRGMTSKTRDQRQRAGKREPDAPAEEFSLKIG